jgi:hypothetical protein
MPLKMSGNIELLRLAPGERIAKDILDAIRQRKLRPGDRLQGEAELSRIYDGSVYNVRKAIQRLKKEKILRSIPKVGVFIAGGQDKPTLPICKNEEGKTVLHFQTGNTPDFLHDFWKNVLDVYSDRFHFVKIRFTPKMDLDPSDLPDIRDCGNPFQQYQLDEMPLLDLSEANGNSLNLLTAKTAAFLHTADLLLFNRALLAKNKFSPPAYLTFAGQLDYLDEMLSSLASSGLELPGTNQQPLFRMAESFFQMFKDICGSMRISQFVEKYIDLARQVTGLWEKYRISRPKRARENLQKFLDGKTPFYFGNAPSWPLSHAGKTSFPVEVYPFLMADDTLQLRSFPLTIHAATEVPVEAIRLVELLQSDPIQRSYAATGAAFPISPENCEVLPYMRTDPFLMSAYRSGRRFFFHSKEEQYIGMNIINVELWDCILFDKKVEKALVNALELSRLYLKTRLDRQTRTAMELSANLYK